MPTSAAIPLMATPTLPPTATATNPPPTLTPVPVVRLCTPLQNIPLNQIEALVSNPYHPPAPGKDDPHAGVDLAVRLPGTEIAVAGHPVQSALAGRVVMTIHDRFPFGNSVLVETPLDSFQKDWWAAAEIPTPAPTLPPRSALTCPAAPAPIFPDPARRSLYVLYAHLLQPATLKPGDAIGCGQVIGAVGQTGNALNPAPAFRDAGWPIWPADGQHGALSFQRHAGRDEQLLFMDRQRPVPTGRPPQGAGIEPVLNWAHILL